jgi:2-dehydropantoate 2-reductase
LHGEFTAKVTATDDPARLPPSDLVLVCVNGYSTRAAAEAARGALAPGGVLLTLQNGLGNLEVLDEVLGAARVMGGLTFHSADLRAPGFVRHTNHGPTYLGERDKTKSARLAMIDDLMRRAEMVPVVEPDIMATIWGKFVHNCGINAVCAITGLRPGHIREVPELDEFQTHVIAEALALVRARGIHLPDPDPMASVKAYCAKKFHRVSMLQHLERGRETEIDSLNGYIVRQSAKLGLKTPYNESLMQLMKGRQYRPAHIPET